MLYRSPKKSGVRLAAHPDDPPMPTMRGQPRLVYQPGMYQRLIDLAPSPSNALELCVGTLAEMTEGDIYEAVDRYSRQGKIAYIHLRNVAGKVPSYRETFIDEGDVDMIRILTILAKNKFDGVVIPDHTPQMTCPAPWHAGMAHTIGFILAAPGHDRDARKGRVAPASRRLSRGHPALAIPGDDPISKILQRSRNPQFAKSRRKTLRECVSGQVGSLDLLSPRQRGSSRARDDPRSGGKPAAISSAPSPERLPKAATPKSPTSRVRSRTVPAIGTEGRACPPRGRP